MNILINLFDIKVDYNFERKKTISCLYYKKNGKIDFFYTFIIKK